MPSKKLSASNLNADRSLDLLGTHDSIILSVVTILNYYASSNQFSIHSFLYEYCVTRGKRIKKSITTTHRFSKGGWNTDNNNTSDQPDKGFRGLSLK
jgi:hypothetical protein